MPRQVTDIPLRSAAPGLSRTVRVVRYGKPEARPKAYVQAALHADEAPSLMVAHHLLAQLDAADAKGEIQGQIIVVPYANPIGLAQLISGEHFGRYDLASGRNFNRGWPDLVPPIADRIEGALSTDPQANIRAIRRAIRECLDEQSVYREIDSLYLTLAREAFDADLVLDLHCDDEGLMHLFVAQEFWPELSDLAGELSSHAVFLQGATGGSTFAEACRSPWVGLGERFPDWPIPVACLSATVELRGFVDVSDLTAQDDAAALLRFLRRRGYLTGGAGEAPAPSRDATRFDACDLIRSPAFGLVVYHVGLGEEVKRGQPVADIIDPSRPPDEARQTVRAATNGVVITRRLKRLVAANQVLAKVAGVEPLTYRTGYLLED